MKHSVVGHTYIWYLSCTISVVIIVVSVVCAVILLVTITVIIVYLHKR